MRIASWNVNSLTVRLGHVLDWLEQYPVEVLCLQELKLTDDKFPVEALAQAGYESYFSGQKTYNGVAILVRRDWLAGRSVSAVVKNNPLFPDEQQRVLSLSIEQLRLICVYVPNGQSLESEKYHYKLQWLAALREWLKTELSRFSQVVIVGDFNIAPADNDVYRVEAFDVLISPAERAAWQALLALGLRDSFREVSPDAVQYTWWDYRQSALKRGHGVRIDHILCSAALPLETCQVDTTPRHWERASDHTPIWAEFAI